MHGRGALALELLQAESPTSAHALQPLERMRQEEMRAKPKLGANVWKSRGLVSSELSYFRRCTTDLHQQKHLIA
jgi:hypothetical protein